MARIDSHSFNESKKGIHRTTKMHDYAFSDYFVFRTEDEDPDKNTILQINMYGSSMRQTPGHASQTIQIDKAVARQLMEIFRKNHMI